MAAQEAEGGRTSSLDIKSLSLSLKLDSLSLSSSLSLKSLTTTLAIRSQLLVTINIGDWLARYPGTMLC